VQKTITLGGELLRKSPFLNLMIMGVDHGGNGETSPPEYGVGDANANCPPPPQILSYKYKKERSVAFKIR